MAFVPCSAVPLGGHARGALGACALRGTPARHAPASRGAARAARAARVVRMEASGAKKAAAVDAKKPAVDAKTGRCADCGCGKEKSTYSLERFLEEAAQHALSTMRFISVTDSAVLETVGRLDYGVTAFDHPTKGRFITLASPDKMFELHVRVASVRSVTLTSSKAKFGDHDLHVIRFRDADGAIVFSSLLQYDPSQGPGHYLAGAVDAFNALRDKVGAEFNLACD